MMTTESLVAHTGARAASGFSVHCTQGALGEWFTVIPRSPAHAAELRARGVRTRVALSAGEVRGQLGRLGLTPRDCEALVAAARHCSTLISTARRLHRWSLRRLFA